MKVAVYTQRVEIVESYGERRDCSDQRIADFLHVCGYLPIPLPNRAEDACEIIKRIKPSGIVLTGGNSLCKYGGEAPERDAMDRELIMLSIKFGIPLFGFCRGMQSIMDYFGNKIENCEGHVAVRHRVYNGSSSFVVNSYHNQACRGLTGGCGLAIMDKAEDGIIESVCHEEKPIVAVMWHPEREENYAKRDIDTIKRLFV